MFNSDISLVDGLSVSSCLYFPPQFILTSTPGRIQLVSLEELFLFDDAGKGDRK